MTPNKEVLVVDDADAVRMLIISVLHRLGFTVNEARTVREAEDVIDAFVRSNGNRILGAVILDGSFPFGDSRDLQKTPGNPFDSAQAVAAHLQAQNLGATILGYSSDPMPGHVLGLPDSDPIVYQDLGKSSKPSQIVQAIVDIP